jgi:carbon monoxide dehydrogenase subunit G
MRLTHRFTLPASVEQAWTAFYFPNRIAPCLPGATLTRVAGDEFDGLLKIKLGPTPLQYEGTATFLERSPEDQRIVVQAHGKDRRGHGTVAVTVTMTFTGVESQTHVEVTSTADFTGQGASLGKAVIQEASDHLVQRLIDCVSVRFATGLGDLPSAEELATATAAEHAPARQQAVGERMSLPADPQEAVQPEPEPAANAVPGRERPTNADTDRQPTTNADTDRQPTTNADIDRQVTTNADTTRSALDAQKASAPHTDYASAASGAADGSAASAPHPPALPVPAGPEGNSLATMVLPRVRRLGAPVLGALAAVSVISSIVRRIRR